MLDVVCSYNMNRSTISMILKNKDNTMKCVMSAVLMMSTIISQVLKGDGGFGETSQCTGAGSASGSRPAQLIGDLRES